MSTTDAEHLLIEARYAGPPGSANGGWVAGRLASYLPEGHLVQVTLRQPPPLEIELDVRVEDGSATLSFGGALIAEAVPSLLAGHVVDPVDPQRALSAMAGYAGAVDHPFPGCFVCGSERPAPDGLGLRPGRLPDRTDTVATIWVPDASLASPDGSVPAHLVWAALDCPGGWSSDLVGRPMVLGRMTAQVDARPEVGDRCVVVGRHLESQGRKTFTASTAYDGDGRILGRADATWIEVDRPPTRDREGSPPI
ncbi:MAG: hypothetical protein QOJ60_3338 [Actinomycetota bacterium]|jgi:hypothetical protein|nr:hypothetical protein [Actinomycetota bacterium]